MASDINRLLTVLNNTGLQTKDNSLYQLLKQLIEGVGSLNGEVASINGSLNIINETIINTVSSVVQLSLSADSSDSNIDISMLPTIPSPSLSGEMTAALASLLPSDSGVDGIDGVNGINGKDGKSRTDTISLVPQDGIDGLDGLNSVQSAPPTLQSQSLSSLMQFISGIGIDGSESEPNVIPFYLNAADIAMLNRTNEFRIIPGLVYFRIVSVGEAQFTVWSDRGGVSSDTDAFLRFVIDEVGTLKGLMGYDQGLDRFILGYNGNSGIRIDSSGNFEIPVNLSKYKGVDTEGWGISAIVAFGRHLAQTGAVASICTYTVGAADGSFEVSTNLRVTDSTSFVFSVFVNYTDEEGTVQDRKLMSYALVGTTFNMVQSQGAIPYLGFPYRIRAKAATDITIYTSGTFTTVTYNVEADIKQVA